MKGPWMAEISVVVNGRSYRLACDDGEEEHLEELASYLDTQVKDIEKHFGKVGDTRLLVMAGLTVADRLYESLSKIEDLHDQLKILQDSKRGAMERSRSEEKELALKLDAAAERLERLGKQLAG